MLSRTLSRAVGGTSAHGLPRLWAQRHVSQDHYLPTPPKISVIEEPEDSVKAREWISKFKGKEIPKKYVELSFSASSGPGGQHVNKTQSKATLRCPVNADWIPKWAHPILVKDPHYTSSSKSILITSSASRSQHQNVEDCLSKLHATILSAASASVKNETSPEKKQHVQNLERAAKERRMKEKSYRSGVKRSRGKSSGGAWD